MLVHVYVHRTFGFEENSLSVQKPVFYSLRVEDCMWFDIYYLWSVLKSFHLISRAFNDGNNISIGSKCSSDNMAKSITLRLTIDTYSSLVLSF